VKREELAKSLAKRAHVSKAAAADQVDRLVSDLLARVRKGESVPLPGLGIFQPGGELSFQFEENATRDPHRPRKGTK